MTIPILLVCIVVIFNLGLGLAVISRDSRTSQNKSFFVLALFSALWAPFNFFGGKVQDPELSKFFIHVDFVIGVLLAGAFWHFGRTIWESVNKVKPRRTYLFIHISVLLVGAFITLLPSAVSIISHGEDIQITNGPLYSLYALTVLFYPIMGVMYMVRARMRARGKPKTQLNIILASLVLAAVIIITPNLLLPLVLDDTTFLRNLQNGAYLGFIIFLGSSTYTIIKHRLFNIRLLIARSVAYMLIVASLGLIYSIAIFGFSELVLGEQISSLSQNVFFVGLALVSAFTFQPVKRFFDKLTDKLFFQDRYDTQQVLNTFGSLLVSQNQIDELLKQSLHFVYGIIRASYGYVEIGDDHSVYKHYQQGDAPYLSLGADVRAILAKNKATVSDELANSGHKELLMKYDIALAVPLRTQNKHIGYLLFGTKQDGGIYSDQDIKLVEIATKELAIAVENARAYAQIQQFNITLQERIAEATKELRVKNRKLHELDKAKDEFISLASHQLRTPLTTVKGYLSMLLEGDSGKINPPQRKVIDLAYYSAQRMVNLITDMLNVSRMSTGKFIIEPTPVNLLSVIKSEVQQLQRSADDHGVKLTMQLPEQCPTVMLDENKIRQVIMNFVDNALYYTPSGGEVRVELEVQSGAIEFRVVDNGIGVSESEKAKLFSKFFRAENAKQQRPDGTGLGLFMAKKVITSQGGSIIFSSRLGRGSTFGFRFALSVISP